MSFLDEYITIIQNSKCPIKATLLIAKECGDEYLDAILRRSIEVANIDVVQVVFFSMKVNERHLYSLMEMDSSSKLTK